MLHLTLVGCHQSEFQTLDFENLLESQSKLSNLKLMLDGDFDEQNQIQLGKGICYLQKLRKFFLKINSKLDIRLKGEELIAEGIQNLSNLQQLNIDINTKKADCCIAQSDKKAYSILNNKIFLNEVAIQFKNKINAEIKQEDVYLINNIQHFRFNMLLNQKEEIQSNQYEIHDCFSKNFEKNKQIKDLIVIAQQLLIIIYSRSN
ncbi:hypothetical protein ABPG72_015572 [Tetrahymena utriculariae]